MKFKSAVIGILFLSSHFALASAKIDPALVGFAKQERGQPGVVRVIAMMEPDNSINVLPQWGDGQSVIQLLQARAQRSFQRVSSQLTQLTAGLRSSPQLRLRNVHWINCSASFDVTPAGLKILSRTPSVTKIYANRSVMIDPPIRKLPASRAGGNLPYDLLDIKLDQVIKEFPSLTGKGVVMGHVDTGVDGSHPALQGKVTHFFDGEKKIEVPPTDGGEHGTHTAGTILGGNRTDNVFGIAPDATLIGSGPLSSYDATLNQMELVADPKAGSGHDIPRAVSNSWNSEGAPDQTLFYKAIEAWAAAGILPVFSAGNSGPTKKSITHPHEHPLLLAVASTGSSGKISDFSSRGPAVFNGKKSNKPDIAAPGEDINSSLPGGKYGTMSGTSMACPHAAGTSALLFQANPKLTAEQVKAILVKSATYTTLEAGKPKWNANYGSGKLNAYAAVKLALATRSLMSGLRMASFSGPEEIDAQQVLSMPRHQLSLQELDAEGSDESATWVSAEQIW